VNWSNINTTRHVFLSNINTTSTIHGRQSLAKNDAPKLQLLALLMCLIRVVIRQLVLCYVLCLPGAKARAGAQACVVVGGTDRIVARSGLDCFQSLLSPIAGHAAVQGRIYERGCRGLNCWRQAWLQLGICMCELHMNRMQKKHQHIKAYAALCTDT
jgi:hypothetical protein